MQPRLLDAEPTFLEEAGSLVVRKDQVISPHLLDSLAASRNATGPAGEMLHVAAIPTIVVEKWMREGFDILTGRYTAREIVNRLKAEGLDGFLATHKRV